jgi:nucleoside-diphosphate-sugar epimerase
VIALKNRKIVLIGGAGFIGHNLAIGLRKQDMDVEIIDSLQVNNLLSFTSAGADMHNRDLYLRIINQRLDMLREFNIPVHVQDAREYHALSRLLDEIRPHVIIHLAAVANAAHSNKDPYSTFDHSLRTLENALDNARAPSLDVEHFVYFSSSMVYGNFPDGSVTEETPCSPLGIYGALKYAGEKMVIAYHQVYDLPYTIVRPSALYGQRCVSRRVGQVFIENAMQNMKVSLRGDGSDRLDFTYITDLVNGIIDVLQSENAKNQIFNLTYGESRSLQDLVTILADHLPHVEIEYLPKDKLMPNRGTLCVEKAAKLIGYRPSYPLEKGFVEYINWYKALF